MRPISLHIENFMNHRKSVINFSGVKSALIVGKTKENDAVSNGVGKSTVFSAIEWVVFNKVHKVTKDKIIREGQKRCSVELIFSIEDKLYKVHRSMSAKGTKNTYLYEKNGEEWESITQRTPTDTEDRLQKIITISHKAFQYCVLFRQADLSGIVEDPSGTETNNKNRVDILKEPLNLHRYSKKEKIAENLVKPIKKDIEVKEMAANVYGDPNKDIEISKQELDKCIAQISEKEKIISNDLQISLAEKQKNLYDLKSTLSVSDADIHQKVEAQHLKVKKLNHTIRDLNDSNLKVQSTITSHTALLASKKEAIININKNISEKQLESHRDITKITQDHKKVYDDEMKGNGLLATAQAEYNYLKISIPDSDQCPSCSQVITAEYRQQCTDRAHKLLDKKNEDIEFYKKALVKCKSFRNKLSTELENAKKHTAEIQTLKNQLQSNTENVSAYEENIANAEIQSKRIEDQMHINSSELQEAIKYYNELKEIAEKSDLAELNTKIFSIAREIKVYEQSMESMRADLQSLKTREGVLNERINSKTQDLNRLNDVNLELSELRKKLNIYQKVQDSFSYKGIPTLIVNTCLNELQLETNKALQELRPDLEVHFDAELNFKYYRNGTEKDYHQLSYGQHVYIALAFKRGMAKVIQRKINFNVGFLEFDEVDSAMDKAGVEALAVAIKKWQDDFLVLVITHNDSLKDKFSHAILVEEGNDGSEANLVGSW